MAGHSTADLAAKALAAAGPGGAAAESFRGDAITSASAAGLTVQTAAAAAPTAAAAIHRPACGAGMLIPAGCATPAAGRAQSCRLHGVPTAGPQPSTWPRVPCLPSYQRPRREQRQRWQQRRRRQQRQRRRCMPCLTAAALLAPMLVSKLGTCQRCSTVRQRLPAPRLQRRCRTLPMQHCLWSLPPCAKGQPYVTKLCMLSSSTSTAGVAGA